MIDTADLIGVPFAYGGRGPNTYDCFGLLIELERRSTGRIVPDVRSPESLAEIADALDIEKFKWDCLWEKSTDDAVPFAALEAGSAIMIRVNGLACHVGFIHKPRHFLHTWEGTGGVTQEKLELWRHRILGVYKYH